ncbi:cyclic pyranopterin monophosphate synthase MoaC [candidate division KSB1 bacterium]
MSADKGTGVDGLSHVGKGGEARMVDVGGKPATLRRATAEARLKLPSDLVSLITATGEADKGNVLETARLAGVMAAKRTPELIPLCHPLGLDHIDVNAVVEGDEVIITAEAACEGKTGVEMEAMTAAAVAALTVYDMIKSRSKAVRITSVRLLAKSGGKSGDWRAGKVGGDE